MRRGKNCPPIIKSVIRRRRRGFLVPVRWVLGPDPRDVRILVSSLLSEVDVGYRAISLTRLDDTLTKVALNTKFTESFCQVEEIL